MGDVACEHPFALAHEGKSLDGLYRCLDVTAIEFHVVLVVDELRIFAAGVVVEAVLAGPDVVVNVAVDALEEEARFYGEPCVAVFRTQHELVAAFTGKVLVAYHPVGTVLQADGVKFVDVGRPP